MFDGSQVNVFIAFAAGLVAFFSPCVLPIIPAYVGYFSGIAFRDRAKGVPSSTVRRTTIVNSLLFVLGFGVVFLLLGFAAGWLGQALLLHRILLQRIGGALLILLGLHLMEVLRLPWLYRQATIQLHEGIRRKQWVGSLLMGATFGFAWTPCIGPVLAVILFWASQSVTALQGAGLLVAFTFGMAVPMILVSVLLGTATGWIRRWSPWMRRVQQVFGAFVALMGLLLLLNVFNILVAPLLKISQPLF